MKKLISLLGCLSILAFTACTDSGMKSKKSTRIDAKGIAQDTTLSDKEKSEKLALAGEQLLTQNSFFYADEVFTESLKYDSENKRAGLYKAILKPQILLKGIYTRIDPMMAKIPKDYEKYSSKEFLDRHLGVEDQGLRHFLLDGPEDLTSEEEVQKVLDTVIDARNELRVFLRDNKSMKLTLNLPERFWSWRRGYAASQCIIKKIDDLTYERVCSKNLSFAQFVVERADIEALQHAAAGMQVLSVFQNAYNAAGAHKLLYTIGNAPYGQFNTDEDHYKEVMKYDSLATLRNEQKLKSVIEMGNDFVAGVRWARSFQEQLCPELKGYKYGKKGNSEILREGKLLEEGVCIKEVYGGKSTTKLLKDIELGLSGNPLLLTLVNENTASADFGEEATAKVRYSNIVNNPVQDMKKLVGDFDECGKIKSLSDNSVNGVFVHDDATEFLTKLGMLGLNEEGCSN